MGECGNGVLNPVRSGDLRPGDERRYRERLGTIDDNPYKLRLTMLSAGRASPKGIAQPCSSLRSENCYPRMMMRARRVRVSENASSPGSSSDGDIPVYAGAVVGVVVGAVARVGVPVMDRGPDVVVLFDHDRGSIG